MKLWAKQNLLCNELNTRKVSLSYESSDNSRSRERAMRVVVVSTFIAELMVHSLIWLSLFWNVAHSGTAKYFRMDNVPWVLRNLGEVDGWNTPQRDSCIKQENPD